MNKNQEEIKKSDVAKKEEEILSFWNNEKIFEKTLEKKSPKNDFIFYDGPPFATGLPHYGHLLAGAIKDIIPRYKTMQGYHVPRKWGWDCHGLPIENLIEKELGLENKKDIEEYGIEKFNTAARNSILRYEKEWKEIVPRSGRFIDMENAYMAMDPEYMESIWWVFGELNKKGLINEGFKAMHLCPRCETTLSNFEVNQGYKDVTDISVTAKFELKEEKGTYLLAWTTTPWTLPGNVALAVGEDIDYVKVSSGADLQSFEKKAGKKVIIQPAPKTEYYIIAKALLKKVFEGKEYKIISEIKGSDLEGKEYIAPFDYYQNDGDIENHGNGWKVYSADFVTTEDGTGIVHIAPAFGSDDMQLGKDNALPFIQHVSKNGSFKHVFAETIDGGDFAGMLVKKKNDLMSTDIEIIKRLAHDGKLFEKKKLVHSYPHCWRCDTPLLNYATTSWYVDVPSIKDKLIKSNKKVNWVPEHVGEGRFGKWLDGAREWALSRSRYWGTPIPVWKNPETEENIIISSYDELSSYAKRSGNKYFAFRHGQAQSNLTGEINANELEGNELTEEGVNQIKENAKEFSNEKIDYIFVSPFQRTKDTAKLLAKEIGLNEENIIEDNRLKEYNPGKQWEGKQWEDFHSEVAKNKRFYTAKVFEDSESIKDLYIRMMDFLFDIEKKYSNKNIIIVSHSASIHMLQFGIEKNGIEKYLKSFYKPSSIENAKKTGLNFIPFPHNNKYEIDIHRPYIDDFEVEQDGMKLERIKDVFDVWFDSSSMPYAQQHYPFKNKEKFEESMFPAQFIAEGLDQTRGWFYVLSVIGNALFDKTPFENVIVNGLILAEDGKKMSKSLKNYPDPKLIFNTSGADAMRLYMINSPVVRAEEFAFSEKGVREVSSKVMGRLRNIMSLYKMFENDIEHEASSESTGVLDEYILARLSELVESVTSGLESYELDKAVRPIFSFVDDFSTWYIRRSRDRFKSDNLEDKKKALETTRFVFGNVAKVIAPFTPFIAEEIWQSLKENDSSLGESVHLENWPIKDIDIHGTRNWLVERIYEDTPLIVGDMDKVRDLISIGLQMRSEAKIKVRQPLASFTLPLKNISEEYHQLIRDEMNVKSLFDGEFSLDTELTEELIEEGNMRELLRGIQKMRKDAGLSSQDNIVLLVDVDDEGAHLLNKFEEEIKKPAGIIKFEFEKNNGTELRIGDLVYMCKIKK